MNEDHGLTRENLLRSLPISLSGDPKMVALARVIAGALAVRREEIERLAIYPNTARLEEGLLDILARDFKVDWWDSDYSVEEKRRTLATSWQVHKTLGTKAAVIKAITSVYPSAALEEWFEYGGKPYHFRLTVRLTESGWDAFKHKQLLEKMQYYKNLRSHREAVVYYMPLVTVENPQRFLFESLLISGRLAPNEHRLDRTRLFMAWAVAEAFASGAGLTARTRMENREKLSARRLLIGPYAIDVMGVEGTFFNGAHRFDGQCFFWYTFKRRPAFYSMDIRARVQSRERVTGSILLNPGGAARNRASGVLRGMYRARDRTGSVQKHAGTALRSGAGNMNTGTAFLTVDGRNYFDGTHSFDGVKKFNGKFERSEL